MLPREFVHKRALRLGEIRLESELRRVVINDEIENDCLMRREGAVMACLISRTLVTALNWLILSFPQRGTCVRKLIAAYLGEKTGGLA